MKVIKTIQLETGRLVFPEVVPLSNSEIVVCGWTGTLYRVSIEEEGVLAHHYVGNRSGVAGVTLSSLSIQRNRALCATRACHAAHWDLLTDTITLVRPISEHPVNTVAFSPDDEGEILLGLGHYSLSHPMRPQAIVEVTRVEEPHELNRRQFVVPGCCVDAIVAWEVEGEAVIVVRSGLGSQKAGILSILRWPSLEPLEYFETEGCNGRAFAPTEYGVLVGGNNAITLLNVKRDSPRRELALENQRDERNSYPQVAVLSDGRTAVASTGQLIDLEAWTVTELDWKVEEHSSVAADGRGRVYFISPEGKLTVCQEGT